MKREPMGKRIERLLLAGMKPQEIVGVLGCSRSYVSVVKSMGSYDSILRYGEAYRRAKGIMPRPPKRERPVHENRSDRSIRIRTSKRYRDVIAAVDAGMTYREAAEKFGLKSRSVVAGIMHRRPEARPA